MLIYVKQHLSKKSSKSYSNTEAELKKKRCLMLAITKYELNSKIFFSLGICEIIAMSIFTDKSESASYDWSYIVGWIALVITAIAAVLSIVFGETEK